MNAELTPTAGSQPRFFHLGLVPPPVAQDSSAGPGSRESWKLANISEATEPCSALREQRLPNAGTRLRSPIPSSGRLLSASPRSSHLAAGSGIWVLKIKCQPRVFPAGSITGLAEERKPGLSALSFLHIRKCLLPGEPLPILKPRLCMEEGSHTAPRAVPCRREPGECALGASTSVEGRAPWSSLITGFILTTGDNKATCVFPCLSTRDVFPCHSMSRNHTLSHLQNAGR